VGQSRSAAVETPVEAVVRLAAVRVVRDGRTILGGVRGVSWTLSAGERWVFVGPNGSGKTTLLRVAAMRLLPTSGTVELLGERYGRTDARAVRRKAALVSHSILRELRPSMSAHDTVLSGIDGSLEAWWRNYDDAEHEKADRTLDQVGLVDKAALPIGVLSEGERQRLLLARALVADPALLLLDEPAAGLDLGARERLVEQLRLLASDPGAPPMALVTHHLEEIPPGITHAALLRKGEFLAAGRAGDVLVDSVVSDCFGVEVEVETAHGRWSAHSRSSSSFLPA